jgi:diguanylate cyclase (GGDEF)-like protein
MPNPNLAFRSSVPPLTKVWNREHAMLRLTAELELARQTPGYLFSILLIQLEGFRMAGQDRLGFASASDMAPRVFAVLTGDLRENETCCHLADDEFLLILPHRREAECRDLAGLLKAKWAASAGARESTIKLRAGWASSAGQESSIEKLFGTADESLARAWANESRAHLLDGSAFETTAVRAAAAARTLEGNS